jgi:phospholipid/cholesterol/gamma-HCH transport system permease protein
MSSPAAVSHKPAGPAGKPGTLTASPSHNALRLLVDGDWTVVHALRLDRQLQDMRYDGMRSVVFDLSRLGKLDTTGAWLLERTKDAYIAAGAQVSFEGWDPNVQSLIEAVQRAEPRPEPHPIGPNPFIAMLARAGRGVESLWAGATDVLGFVGLVVSGIGRTIINPSRLRFTSLVHHMEEAGLDAVPIVALMSFLIGAVLAYQGSEQLARFGATVFTVNLVAISFLREIGILLTAIMVAGRSGSAFTAQIGSMKMREEIDAMRTLGLDPMDMLIVPRILALVIMLPFLAFIAGLAGLAGGGFVAVVALDMSPLMYVERLNAVISPNMWHFWVGIIKAPFFAFLIGLIGCYEGLRVSGSAESLGRRVTQSVVEGIFVVIIADAVFSILFVNLGI